MMLLLKSFIAGLIALLLIGFIYRMLTDLIGYRKVGHFFDTICAFIVVICLIGVVCIPIGMIALHMLGLI
jgi:hypothetical protein